MPLVIFIWIIFNTNDIRAIEKNTAKLFVNFLKLSLLVIRLNTKPYNKNKQIVPWYANVAIKAYTTAFT